MHVDGTAFTLGPGDAVLAPAGSDHDLRNSGDGPAVLLVIWGPPAGGLDWTRFGSGRAAAAVAAGGGSAERGAAG
jgi:mannose-6-phosphate isomerase-like protein (cupin superfamily)